MIVGTVDYLAPEQARGRSVDARTDLYAMGVLLYHLLAGRLPFDADSPTAMMFQHAYERPVPLRKAAPETPPPLLAVVERMTAKNPNHRYASCAEVLQDVQALLEGRPVNKSLSGVGKRLTLRLGSMLDMGRPSALGRAFRSVRGNVARTSEWMTIRLLMYGPSVGQRVRSVMRLLATIIGGFIRQAHGALAVVPRMRITRQVHRTYRRTIDAAAPRAEWVVRRGRAATPFGVKRTIDAVVDATRSVGRRLTARLTGYWPSCATSTERTCRQVDRAVEDYQARRDAVADLLDEARRLRSDLQEQFDLNQRFAHESADHPSDVERCD
ncbi:MAG: hypothetical protein AAF961_19795, partial [Planctomycetota bacterium]